MLHTIFIPIPRTYFQVGPHVALLGFLFNLFIQNAREPFQHVLVQFLCFLTPLPEREKKHLNRQFAANQEDGTPASGVASKFSIHYTIAFRAKTPHYKIIKRLPNLRRLLRKAIMI